MRKDISLLPKLCSLRTIRAHVPKNDDIFQLAELVYWCFVSHLGVVLIHLRYGGWKKSCTVCYIRNPMKHGIFSISTGAGSLPSTAAAENCLTIVLHQYLKFRFHVDLEQNDTKSTWHQTGRNKKQHTYTTITRVFLEVKFIRIQQTPSGGTLVVHCWEWSTFCWADRYLDKKIK